MVRDWRENYVVCEHIADDPDLEGHRQGFRVCCTECFKKGFLTKVLEKRLVAKIDCRLSVGRIKEEKPIES